jgi:DNA-binding CsgD family transcriptional regulator
VSTIKNHKNRLFKMLKVKNSVGLINHARQQGFF